MSSKVDFFTAKTPSTPRAIISKEFEGRKGLSNLRGASSYGPAFWNPKYGVLFLVPLVSPMAGLVVQLQYSA